MKTFFVHYEDGSEETFKATSFDATSKWVRIRRGKSICAIIAASKVSRVAETSFLRSQMAPSVGREEIEKWLRETATETSRTATKN